MNIKVITAASVDMLNKELEKFTSSGKYSILKVEFSVNQINCAHEVGDVRSNFLIYSVVVTYIEIIK